MAYTYIVECSDKTYYTGATTDLQSRINKHNSGKGAKYTRGRLPVKLVFFIEVDNYNLACKYESYIKTFNRKTKISLINAFDNKTSNIQLINLILENYKN